MVFNHLIDISLKKLFTGVAWIVVDRMYNSFYWVILRGLKYRWMYGGYRVNLGWTKSLIIDMGIMGMKMGGSNTEGM